MCVLYLHSYYYAHNTLCVFVAAASCSAEGTFASDSGNMCWYHECILNAAGGLEWLPRRCAWMSRVSSNFVSGESNPCTVRIDEAERCKWSLYVKTLLFYWRPAQLLSLDLCPDMWEVWKVKTKMMQVSFHIKKNRWETWNGSYFRVITMSGGRIFISWPCKLW